MKSFVFEVRKDKTVIGYEVLDLNKRVTNTYLNEGFYLAFDEDNSDLDMKKLPIYLSVFYEKKIIYITTRFLRNSSIIN